MNTKVLAFLSFSAGGLIGYLAAKKLLEDKYAQIAQEEIDSVKEAFCNIEPREQKDVSGETIVGEELVEKAVVAFKKYSGYDENAETVRIVSPQEFDEERGHDTFSLTYYADDVLVDSSGHILSDDEIIDMLGSLECLEHFGEYEKNSVLVVNDRLKADYEILRDGKMYADILKAAL